MYIEYWCEGCLGEVDPECYESLNPYPGTYWHMACLEDEFCYCVEYVNDNNEVVDGKTCERCDILSKV